MTQAPVEKVPAGGNRSANRLAKIAAFVGAMALGAVLALAGSAAFAAYQAGTAATTHTGSDVATDVDRQVVGHNQSERSEAPVAAPAATPAAALRAATDNDRAVVTHNQQERAEAPSGSD